MRMIALGSALVLAGCGVATNPEDGPVVLQCTGEEVSRGGNGEVVREHTTRFYRVDGVKYTIAIWNDTKRSFDLEWSGLTVTPNELKYSRNSALIGDLTALKTITFDRASGRANDEFAMSNGGVVRFSAVCKPVSDPIAADKKF